MTSNIIDSHDLIKWVPGQILSDSNKLTYDGVSQRAFRYQGQDVEIPPMKDFMIVSYIGGGTKMQRSFEGVWKKTECMQGDCSLLTRSQLSHWHWTQSIDVNHVYLTEKLMSTIAQDILERSIEEVRLRDVLRVHDPVMSYLSSSISQEVKENSIGGSLLVESLATQLVVHLLRHYSDFTFKCATDAFRFSRAEKKCLQEYIDSRLGETISLTSLASVVSMGQYSFSKMFKLSFGVPPYTYVIERRLLKAQQLIIAGKLPLKTIAYTCGFSDQAHLTRAFKSRFKVTPSAFKDQTLQGSSVDS